MGFRQSSSGDINEFAAPSSSGRSEVFWPAAEERWPRREIVETGSDVSHDEAASANETGAREYSQDADSFYQVAPDKRFERAEYERARPSANAAFSQNNQEDSQDFAALPRSSDGAATSSSRQPTPYDYQTHEPREASRGAAYEASILTLFRTRLRLVCALTLVLLPLCNLLHRHFTPNQLGPLLTAYLCLSGICLATFVLANRLKTLRGLRLLTLFSYALFCFKASMAITITGDANPAFLLGSHANIILSLLLLPLSVWECLAIGAIALGTLAWSSWWILIPQETALYVSHLFITSITVAWVIVIAYFQNATRRQAFNATFDLSNSASRLRELTFRDALTGGYNRRYLENALDTEIARATRHGRPLSVVMFDLDNFKKVNDSRGHIVGDKVLCAVWDATMRSVRGIDTAARYGGDEFALVLPEADAEAARMIVTRLQASVVEELQSRFQRDDMESQVTLSIGIATALLARPISSQQLLDHADQFLYQAKRAGKNSVAS